jgi:hypothetical protein
MRQRNSIIWGIVLFFITYSVVLILWIQVKPYYGNTLTHVGSRLAAWSAGFRVETVHHGKEVATITFAYPVLTKHGMGDILLDVKIAVSQYSFNVPLTFALVAGLFPFFRWRARSLIEACIILLFIHLLYISFFCSLQLFYHLAQAGIKTPSKPLQFFLQFMWAFADNMVIRFEPFLVAVYLWFRNREGIRMVRAGKRKK